MTDGEEGAEEEAPAVLLVGEELLPGDLGDGVLLGLGGLLILAAAPLLAARELRVGNEEGDDGAHDEDEDGRYQGNPVVAVFFGDRHREQDDGVHDDAEADEDLVGDADVAALLDGADGDQPRGRDGRDDGGWDTVQDTHGEHEGPVDRDDAETLGEGAEDAGDDDEALGAELVE